MARRLSTQATVVDSSVSDDEMPLQDPHVDPTMLDSLAEDLCATEQDEPSRDTIPARFAHREVDECSSAGSESCWGETEDIGDDEVVEWGTLPFAQAVPAPHDVDCDRVAHRVEHQGSQGRLIRHSQLETVAASSPPSLQNRFVPCSSRTVRRLRLVSNNASVDDSAQSVLVEPVHAEAPQDVPRVVVPVVNMAMDDSESDIRAESVHGDANPLFNQNTSDTETIDGREESEMGGREDRWEGSQASGSEEFVEPTNDEFDVVEARISAETQRALRDLEEVVLEDEFAHRGCVMSHVFSEALFGVP